MREHDGLFACSGIVYNHESERRPERFVTRRITRAAAEIALGLREELTLGSLEAVRDWSFAGDIVHGAWLMLQQERPEDYVLASGVPHTVAEFAAAAFACVDLDAERYVRVDPTLVRARERTPSVGDPSRARERLGWEPEVSFAALVRADGAGRPARAAGRGAGQAVDCPAHMTTVGVIGLGYVGLPLAVAFAREGCDVIAVDLDARKIEAIEAGDSYIEDVSSEQLRGGRRADPCHLALCAAGEGRRGADLRADAADGQPRA